jgi:hypothetical protein
MSMLFVQCERNLNKILMVATLIARNADKAMVGSGRFCVWPVSVAVGFVLVCLAGIWLQLS